MTVDSRSPLQRPITPPYVDRVTPSSTSAGSFQLRSFLGMRRVFQRGETGPARSEGTLHVPSLSLPKELMAALTSSRRKRSGAPDCVESRRSANPLHRPCQVLNREHKQGYGSDRHLNENALKEIRIWRIGIGQRPAKNGRGKRDDEDHEVRKHEDRRRNQRDTKWTKASGYCEKRSRQRSDYG